MPLFELGNGRKIMVPTTVGSNGSYMDFIQFGECKTCKGKPDSRGFVTGGYISVPISNEHVSRGTYLGLCACPECAFGAFRRWVQQVPFPHQVKMLAPDGERLLMDE